MKGTRPVVSMRYYLADAGFLVGLEGNVAQRHQRLEHRQRQQRPEHRQPRQHPQYRLRRQHPRIVTCRQHPAHRRCWRYPRQEQEIGTRSGSALPERHGTPYQREGARWHGALG